MKILFLLRYFPVYGGGESVTLKLANAFIEKGNTVGVFYLWTKNSSPNPFISDKLKQFKMQEHISAFSQGEFCKSDENKIFSELHYCITSFKPEIVVNQWLPSEIVYKANTGIGKIITCIHTTIYDAFDTKGFKHKVIRYIFGPKILYNLQKKHRAISFKAKYLYSDAIIVLSQSYVSDFCKLLHLKTSQKIYAISNPASFNDWLSEEEIECKENMVLFVGRFSAEKQLDILLHIWSLINQKISCDWKLVFCGDGDEFENMQRLAKELNCKNITFVGRCQPQEFYKKAKIFMLTSAYEGFPMVLLEAQQNGCVPISFNSFSAAKDIIKNDKNGCLVPNYDINSYIEKLESLMLNDMFLKELGKNALKTSKEFSINCIVEQWLALFSSLYNKDLV